MEKKRPEITMADIAKAAGTSPATVSRVINGSRHKINPEVQARVLETVRRLGYSPNPFGRMLKKNDMRELAAILPSMQNPFYIEVLSGIERAAHDHGYDVIIFNSNHSREEEIAHIRSVMDKRIKGLLIAHADEGTAHVRPFLEQGGMMVLLDQERVQYDNCISIDVGCLDGTQAVTEYLLSLGHRRIAYASLPLNKYPRRQCLEGFQRAHRAHNLPVSRELLLFAGDDWGVPGEIYEFACGRRLGEAFLRLDPMPTGIVAINDMLAFGCIAALRDGGVSIPEAVSVAGFDNIQFASMINPALTTVDVPSYEIGRRACEELLMRIDCGETFAPSLLRFHSTLRLRASVAEPRPGAG